MFKDKRNVPQCFERIAPGLHRLAGSVRLVLAKHLPPVMRVVWRPCHAWAVVLALAIALPIVVTACRGCGRERMHGEIETQPAVDACPGAYAAAALSTSRPGSISLEDDEGLDVAAFERRRDELRDAQAAFTSTLRDVLQELQPQGAEPGGSSNGDQVNDAPPQDS